MSFFGFDTSLPRDKPPLSGKGPIFKAEDPFDPTNEDDDYDDDAAFEEKLRGLTAGAQEDVEIYTWGGGGGEGGYDGLGDLLDEAGDDFNDDTFGFSGQEVGKDFDFSGTGGIATAASTTNNNNKAAKGKTNDAAFASTMDDFWFMPEVKPAGALQQATASPPPQPQPAKSAEQPQMTPASTAPRTLEEIEAEMRLQRQRANIDAPSAASQGRRQLTMEEVEAEMRAKRSQPTTSSPADLSAMMQKAALEAPGQNRQTPSTSNLSNAAFPPLGTQSSTRSIIAPTMPSSENTQAHMARMRGLLDALPPPLQNRILSLPPYMQFGAVEGISREFPALTVAGRVEKLPQQIENPSLWPRADGSPDEVAHIRALIDAAFIRLEEADNAERRRQIRLAKINAMSRYNNLMTLSDKDFITRIQVSQLVTNDPYSDDFYAHIFFALRGNGANPGLMGKKPLTGDSDDKAITPAGGEETSTRPGKQKKQQANRRETAMTRMQQQVERIVKNRKERIEKSTQGAALERALGRVTMSSTKTPRQMLQVEALKDDKLGNVKQGEEEGAGHAQDAVRQALQGASLGDQNSGFQKRPPLKKLEVLSILEKLYDIVLALEQSRRSAPSNANESQDEDAITWRKSRDDLTMQLWTELRVLEPLEISDPHPFISLLSTVKGKRLLPRVLRHLSNEQTLTAMTMIVASFDTLDVVKESTLLDELPSVRNIKAMEKRNEVQRQTEAFSVSIVPNMLTLMTTAPMQIVSGMLALFIERNDPVRVAQSKAGIAFLTIFLSRAETLRQQSSKGPAASELSQWSEIFNLLIQRLTQSSNYFSTLFPSTRAKQVLPFGTFIDIERKNQLELEDQSVWQLMAALAVSANMNQQQVIVTGLREKILENVLEAKQWKAANQGMSNGNEEADIRIRNVNLLLHALNLDAAQITV